MVASGPSGSAASNSVVAIGPSSLDHQPSLAAPTSLPPAHSPSSSPHRYHHHHPYQQHPNNHNNNNNNAIQHPLSPAQLHDAPLVRLSEHLLQENGSISGQAVANAILPIFPDLLSALPSSPCPALSSIDGRQPLSHDQIRECILETGRVLHSMRFGRGHRVALVLPNGSELALALLCITTWCSCVPLNAFGAAAELEADIQAADVDLVIGLTSSYDVLSQSACSPGHQSRPLSPHPPPPPPPLDPHKIMTSLSAAEDEGSVRHLAARCNVPFCGLSPDRVYAGRFTLVPPALSTSASPCFSSLLQTQYHHSHPNQHHQKHPYDSSLDEAALLSPTATTLSCSPRQQRTRQQLVLEADRSAGDTHPAPFWNENNHDDQASRFRPNGLHDEILVLFTSGTTGSKKLVPHVLSNVLVATACISISWKLSPEDTNCNLMPLFHVGGIIRQVFSPIYSGGCVICCPSFDPAIFWHLLLNQRAFTWYYAAPTMHQIILQFGRAEGHLQSYNNNSSAAVASTLPRGGGPPPRLRMIANAAGGLLPSLARELREAFGAFVLPSYGMTECMPITSPPATYQLEKPGTSGVAVGPEVAILCLETLKHMPPGKEGPICVRGAPCFGGYGSLGAAVNTEHGLGHGHAKETADQTQTTFLKGGWFNTGDLGYMDADGYLYITGRSKEVINRGGEIISPLEVEEAVNAHPDVLTCVAFSTQHAVLQEVVGLILVPALNRPKVDLPTLHSFLGEGRLAAPKWPQCLVYMNAVPKSHTNKLLRVKLGKRLSLPELNDSMYAIERTFEAQCPPQGTPVSVAIPCQRVKVRATEVQTILREHLVAGTHQDLIVVPHPRKIGTLVVHVYNIDRLRVVRVAREQLDAFAVPSHVCLMRERDQELGPPQPSDALGSILQEEASKGQGPMDPLVIELQDLFQELLNLDCLPAPDTNFFNLGGSSMLASQLASKVRKFHHVSFGGAEVFHHPSCQAIAKVIHERSNNKQTNKNSNGDRFDRDSVSMGGNSASMAVSSMSSKPVNLQGTPFDPHRMDISPGVPATIFQLMPLLVIYPLWQLTRFFLFFRCLSLMLVKVPGVHSLVTFVATLVIFHFVWVTVTPIMFVAVKWIVIGKYRRGRYPIWGEYYIRWWFIDILRKLVGRGIWGSNEASLNFYYRLLGATIMKNARISLEADVAEFDLVSIGEGAAIEYATVRAFGVDNGCMILGPIHVGNFGSVGARSVVAPFTSIPDGAHLGPVTSSYEICTVAGDDVKHLKYNRRAMPEPSLLSQMLFVGPITFFVDSVSHLPALGVLYWMVSMPWHHNDPFSSINDLMAWLCEPRRIPFYIGIRIARAIAAPIVYMACAILIKWLVIGKFHEGPRDVTSEWQLIRHHLSATLFSRQNMQDVTDIIGRHYELVSWLYRLLGAKVGKRVFWPGHQPIFSGEFDLLEIGDDVVFGSRAAMFCTTVDSCEKIILCAGSNVSDNTVVLPGAILGKGAVLGSNSLCPAGRYLPEASVWLGARGGEPVLLEKGPEDYEGPVESAFVEKSKLQMEGDDTTLRPFGRAFYKREAKGYFVLPLSAIILYTLLCKIFIAAIHTVPLLGALHLTGIYFYGLPVRGRQYRLEDVSFSDVYIIMLSCFLVTHFVRCSIWIGIEISAKWLFMGRRQEGRYNYDNSNYGQNWEMYQLITKVRSSGRMNFMDLISGTPFLSTFYRLQGAMIGEDCCLYPTGADPQMPEPDLVTMGNRCVIDCASVVCHLNTRGNFELVKIVMENNVTLRTRSRIQQGVHMESGSMLLEKSLAMTGEVIESDSVWQGAPASRVFSYDTSSIGTHDSVHNAEDLGVAGAFV